MRSDGSIACRPNATFIEFQDRNISDISDRVLTIPPFTRVDLSCRGSTLSISHSPGRERPTTLDSSCCIPHLQRIVTEPAQQDMLCSNHSIPQGKTSHPIANHNHSLSETSVNEFNIADALMTLASPPRAKPGRDVFYSSKSTKNEINPFDQSSNQSIRTKENEIVCNHREGPRHADLKTTAKDDVNINQIAVTEESKVSDLDQIQLAIPTQMALVSTACDGTQVDATCNEGQGKDPLTEEDPPKSSISIDQSEENCNVDAKESVICNHREGARPDEFKTTSRDSKSLSKAATPDLEYVDLPWHTHEFTKVEPIQGLDSASKACNAKSDMVWTDSRTCCLCHVSGDDDAGVYPTNCSEYDQIKGSGRLGGWMHAGCAIWSSEVWENPIGGMLSGATKT